MSLRTGIRSNLLLILPAGIIILLLFVLYESVPRTLQPQSQPREVGRSSLPLQLVSAIGEDCAAIPASSRTLIVSDLGIAYPYSDGSARGPSLRLRSIADGSLIWQSDSQPFPSSIISTHSHLYVSSNSDVRAYDIGTGELQWETSPYPSRTAAALVPSLGEGLQVYYTDDSFGRNTAHILELNPLTGQTIDAKEFPLDELAFMVPLPSFRYAWIIDDEVWLGGPPPTSKVWRIPSGNGRSQVAHWPIQFGETLIAATVRPSALFAIDIVTGETRWRVNRTFASVPVLFEGTVYVLASDARLVAFDIGTGREIGQMDFAGNNSESPTPTLSSALSSSDQYLLVYLSDSCQFFVFKYSGA